MRAPDSESFPEPPPPITRQPWFKWAVLTIVLGSVALVLLAGAALYFLVEQAATDYEPSDRDRSALITLSDLREVFPELESASCDEEYEGWGDDLYFVDLTLQYRCYGSVDTVLSGGDSLYIDSELSWSQTGREQQETWDVAVLTLEDDWDWLSDEEDKPSFHQHPLENVAESALYLVVEEEGEPTGCSLLGAEGPAYLRLDLYGFVFESPELAGEFLRAQLDEVAQQDF